MTNPHATSTTARGRELLARALDGEAEFEVAETANRGHAAALACRAMRAGADAVIAFGGDGTVNEVVNGLLTDGVHPGLPALGVVPAGSTNVFARALGLPEQPVAAAEVAVAALRSASRRAVSMGQVSTGSEERWFAFAAGMGFDAAIVGAVERQRDRGHRSTHLLYARVGVREFFRADRRHPRLHVELADGTRLDDVHFAIVANTDPWTFVGSRPLRPTPQAGFDTGLALYARARMGAPGILFSMARLAAKHPRIGRRGATVVHDQPTLTVFADEPMPVQVDGDYLGVREKLRFESAAAAIDVLV